MTDPTPVYAQPEDVRYLLSTDRARRSGTAATLDDPNLTGHLVDAEAEVNSALAAGGYSSPLTPTPPLVKAVTLAIAAWLADLQYRGGKAHESRMDPVVQRYDRAQTLLKGWASGKVPVPGAPPPASSSASGVAIGEPVNPTAVGLTEPLVQASYQRGGIEQEYDHDWWRWGESRGWF